MRISFHAPLLLALELVLLATQAAFCQEEGLYADFTTNRGKFTARLEMDKAPRTTANFAGLASGVIPWVDLNSGQVRTDPFYNGNTFHRVKANFVIQAGSPSGEGTDGPGYTFRDEFHAELRHDRPYILSMANSGLHSNGSQFFITVKAEEHLNDKHSVFGEVISGTEVIDQINQVPVGEFDRPIEPQIIEEISIRRIGEAAMAFDLLGHGLPVAREAVPFLIDPAPAQVVIDFSRSNHSGTAVYRSDDLQIWTGDTVFYQSSEEAHRRLDITEEIATNHQRFYRFIDVAYPEPLHTPTTIAKRRIDMDITSHSWTFSFDIDESGTTGNFFWNQSEAIAIEEVGWVQEAYRGIMTLRFEPETNLVPIRASLSFETENSGIIRGTVFNTIPFDIIGTFTMPTAE